MSDKPATIDAYLATLPADQAAALQALRLRVNALLPGNQEVISYAMPGHKLKGKMIAGYAGFARHLGFYPHSGGVVPGFDAELKAKGFGTSKSGVIFTPDQPIPEDLLARIIAARLAEAGVRPD